MEIVKNQRGGIILNTLVYSAMVLFMSMMLLEFVKAHVYGQYAHLQRLNFQVLQTNLSTYLSRSAVCANGMLSNGVKIQYSGSKKDLTEIAANGQSYLKLDQVVGSGMTISSIRVQPNATAPVLNGAETMYSADLIIEAKKSGATFGGSTLDNSRDPIKLNISSDAAGNIQSCSSDEAGAFDFTKAEQCSVANVSASSGITVTDPKGVVYKYHMMVKMHNGQTKANGAPAGNLRIYCIVPVGTSMGYLGACMEGAGNCPY